jgi:hypothetical protein
MLLKSPVSESSLPLRIVQALVAASTRAKKGYRVSISDCPTVKQVRAHAMTHFTVCVAQQSTGRSHQPGQCAQCGATGRTIISQAATT